mgnify:CR=1 FL=1
MTKHIEDMDTEELRVLATALQEENAWLKRHMSEDPLTGTYNRRGFKRVLKKEHARLVREDTPLGVLYLDLNDFKPVNDKFGHGVGDLLLQAVCARIRSCIRDTDALCRVGGDEFTVILHNTRNIRTEFIARRIAQSIAGEPFRFDGVDEDIRVSVSVGGVSTRDRGVTVQELIDASDRLMYQAKESSKTPSEQDPANEVGEHINIEVLTAS